MKEISFQIEKDFVRIWFIGSIRVEAINKLISDLVHKEDLPSDIKVLIDSRRAKYETKPDDLPLIIKKLKVHNDKFKSIKLTIIQQNPYETAILMIMQELLKGIDNIYFKIFSTEQAAVLWLKTGT
jgi:hypothetical protein